MDKEKEEKEKAKEAITKEIAVARDKARIADDAVDLVCRAVDDRRRLAIAPHQAVKIVALTRGLAMAAETAELMAAATHDPKWAQRETWRVLDEIASGASKRVREDQEAEAKVLRTLAAMAGSDVH